MTTNVSRLGAAMIEGGLVTDGKEQVIEKWQMHVYTHYFFSPITSTRVMRKSKNTYCIHHFAGTWKENDGLFSNSVIVRELVNFLVQAKRIILKLIK